MTEDVVKTAADAIRHYWLAIVALTVVGLLGAGALLVITPPTYEAQAVIYVDPGGQPGALQASDGLLSRYYVEQATSQRVLDRARSKLGARGSQISGSTISATALRGTNTIGISARAEQPELAADMANAVAVALREQNREDAASRFQASIDYLNSELARLDRARASETREAVLTTLNAQYLTTYTNLENTMLAQTREMDAVSVMQPARPPTTPIGPSVRTYLLIGSLAGLIVGLLAALLIARFDDRLREIRELGGASGAPVVVAVRSGGSSDRDKERREAGYDAALVQLLSRQPGARTIMVAGASAPESAAEVAAALGSAAVRSGRRVRVVLPSLAVGGENGALGKDPGLTAIAADTLAEIERVLNADGQYAISLVVVPPPADGPSALGLARSVDAIALVATRLQTRIGEVRSQAEELNAAGGTLAAAFLLTD